METTHYDRLVSGFYRAASGCADWADVLDDLATSLDAWATPLMGVDKRTGTMLFTHHGGIASPAVALDYIRGYHAIDPRVQLLMSAPYGTWVHCHEHFDDAYVAASPFYQDFLLPHGGRYVSGRKVFEDDETVMVLGLHRGPARGPFTDSERGTIQRLAAHVEHAMVVYRHWRRNDLEAGAGYALLDQFAWPMLIVDELGGIRFSNTAAKAALTRGDNVVDRGGILTCLDPASHGNLMAALQDLGLQGATHHASPARRRILRVDRPGGTSSIVIGLSVIDPAASLNSFGRAPAALVMLQDAAVTGTLEPFLVAEMFGLTPAEARVAVLLHRGLAAEDVAKRHDVSIATVRAQLKAVYSKVGVNRQVDLLLAIGSLAAFDGLSLRREC